MPPRHAPLTIRAGRGFCTSALVAGAESGVRLIAYRPEWMRSGTRSNVVPLHRPEPPSVLEAMLILPLPANDNIA